MWRFSINSKLVTRDFLCFQLVAQLIRTRNTMIWVRVRDFKSQGRQNNKKKEQFSFWVRIFIKQTTPVKSIYKGERRGALRRKIQESSGKELSKLLWNSYLYNYPKKKSPQWPCQEKSISTDNLESPPWTG